MVVCRNLGMGVKGTSEIRQMQSLRLESWSQLQDLEKECWEMRISTHFADFEGIFLL